MWKGRGELAQGLGIRLVAFGGAYWPLAPEPSDPLWVRTCFGCVKGGGGGWHKALVVGSVGLWRRLLASRP